MREFKQLTIFDVLEDLDKPQPKQETQSVSSLMLKQFNDIKSQYPNALLLFRCGDFYEAYAQDANEVSRILGIVTTHRSTGDNTNEVVVMAGFPFHALDTYLPRLVRAGKRVAICDQLENPKEAKK